MRLQGRIVALRAVEPRDVDLLYGWENDVRLWAVSGTTEPFSRAQIEQFVERQLAGADLLRTGQLRLMIDVRQADGLSRADGAAENENGSMSGGVSGGGGFRTVGAVDLFEYDPLNGRAGLGILIYGEENRRRGYASDTLEVLGRYAREQLRLMPASSCGCTSSGAPSGPEMRQVSRSSGRQGSSKRGCAATGCGRPKDSATRSSSRKSSTYRAFRRCLPLRNA